MITHHVDAHEWKHAIVTGFYTPDYEPLAISFSENLKAHGIPHALYDVPKSAWEDAILLKPTIVSRAMADYPGATIILMDIDCVLSDTIAPLLSFHGDISLCLWARFKFNYGSSKSRLRVLPSSRVVAFKPSEAAANLLKNWSALCRRYKDSDIQTDDEQILMLALGATDNLAINNLDRRFIARDPGYATPHTVVLHHSAHGQAMRHSHKRKLKVLKRKLISILIGRPYPVRKKFQDVGIQDTLRDTPVP
ncbi:MAG: hypothetical protein JSR99_03535 [Proteobacteria bacterium]|nr:hypothetical protein [Pseudomonadota bacterium]